MSNPRLFAYGCSTNGKGHLPLSEQRHRCLKYYESLSGFEWGGWLNDRHLHYPQFWLLRPRGQELFLRLKPGDRIVCAELTAPFVSGLSATHSLNALRGRRVYLRILDLAEDVTDKEILANLPIQIPISGQEVLARCGVPQKNLVNYGWVFTNTAKGVQYRPSKWDRQVCEVAWDLCTKVPHTVALARLKTMDMRMESRPTVKFTHSMLQNVIKAYENQFPLMDWRKPLVENSQ